MDYEEAISWLKGERSVNGLPIEPVETLPVRIAQTDAAMTQQAYYIVKAYNENLIEDVKDYEKKSDIDPLVNEFITLFTRHHHECEDGWYSCPKSEDGCWDDQYDANKCNCGADENNEMVKVFAEKLAQRLSR